MIDKAWACLLREFKEKVKKEYARCVKIDADDNPNLPAYAVKSAISRRALLEKLFGEHNLTSDAEGEVMLTVSRKRVQETYKNNCDEIRRENIPSSDKDCYDYANEVLKTLFGSKCLPDEACNVASSNVASNVASTEPKPAEPKFKVGDTASYVCSPMLKHKCTVTKVMQNEHSGKWEYNVMFEWGKPGMWIPESDLEPYTEPTNEGTRQEQCVPKNAESGTRLFDIILKYGFRNERRLNIAAMAMQGYLSSNGSGDPKEIACYALAVANALIKSSEKGGTK